MGERIRIDDNWRFMRGDFEPKSPVCGWGGAKARAFSFGAVSEDLDDTKWRALDLPHDFVVEGDYTQIRLPETDMQKIPEMESMDSRHFAAGSLEGGAAWYRKHFRLSEEEAGKRVAIVFEGVYRASGLYLNEYYIGTHHGGYDSFSYDITDFVRQGENVLAMRVDASGREGW